MSNSTRKLPFWSTLKDAHILIGQNFGVLAQITLPYLLALIVVLLPLNWLVHPYLSKPAEDFSAVDWGHMLQVQCIVLAITALLAVAWHRFLLLKEKPSGFFNKKLVSEYWVYFSLGFLIYASVMAPLVLGTEGMEWFAKTIITSELNQADLASNPVAPNSNRQTELVQSLPWEAAALMTFICVWALLLSFIPARLSLALPACAIGKQEASFVRFSWNRTKGNFLRLFSALVLTFWPLFLALFLTLELWNVDNIDRIGYALQETSFSVIYLATGILWITFLTVAYKHFADDEEHQH